MKIKAVFEHISKSEGISIDDVAKKLGVAKSTLYYSINKDELSLKLKKQLNRIYPDYEYLINVEEIEDYDLNKVADFVIANETKLLEVDKFRLWLQTKVQEGVIEVLSINKEGK
ncbi:hypothetical protein ATE84_2297 [Aquimarina sp. MAR_2010_214]|uniref:hypothetical protein n=1 Tax=Aquimarina sp. MAR_2010_214 TaxID=1250026 RepID=UPI000C7120F5|nr:hypothetical protein [Aquimarina sp. MAR_2010_214]PKV50242.1 hypothetical protein ATE84_2297 [Aquimarina sp. MAR_2010_214]